MVFLCKYIWLFCKNWNVLCIAIGIYLLLVRLEVYNIKMFSQDIIHNVWNISLNEHIQTTWSVRYGRRVEQSGGSPPKFGQPAWALWSTVDDWWWSEIRIYIYMQNMYNMVEYLCISYISDCVYHAFAHLYTYQVGAWILANPLPVSKW